MRSVPNRASTQTMLRFPVPSPRLQTYGSLDAAGSLVNRTPSAHATSEIAKTVTLTTRLPQNAPMRMFAPSARDLDVRDVEVLLRSQRLDLHARAEHACDQRRERRVCGTDVEPEVANAPAHDALRVDRAEERRCHGRQAIRPRREDRHVRGGTSGRALEVLEVRRRDPRQKLEASRHRRESE